MLPDDDKWYAIETCKSSESVLKKWFKINDIQLVHLLVVWWSVQVCLNHELNKPRIPNQNFGIDYLYLIHSLRNDAFSRSG